MGVFLFIPTGGKSLKCALLLVTMAFTSISGASAQALAPELPEVPPLDIPNIPNLKGYANPKAPENNPFANEPELVLSAKLSDKGQAFCVVSFGVYSHRSQAATASWHCWRSPGGGTTSFNLAPGSYLVHVAFGRAGATKRITMTRAKRTETMILDAGGVKLNATLSGGGRIPPDQLRFSIYEDHADQSGERALIIPDVKPDSVVRLNTGTYQIVSNYGTANAVIRSDIRVEAGKITEANVEHRAALLTMKLVREAGGEALADTAWCRLDDVRRHRAGKRRRLCFDRPGGR